MAYMPYICSCELVRGLDSGPSSHNGMTPDLRCGLVSLQRPSQACSMTWALGLPGPASQSAHSWVVADIFSADHSMIFRSLTLRVCSLQRSQCLPQALPCKIPDCRRTMDLGLGLLLHGICCRHFIPLFPPRSHSRAILVSRADYLQKQMASHAEGGAQMS